MDVRKALLQAVARDRLVPTVQVRPSSAPRHPPELAGLVVEELQFRSDDSPQGWVPLRLVKRPEPWQAQQAQQQQGPQAAAAAQPAPSPQPPQHQEAAGEGGVGGRSGSGSGAVSHRLPVAVLLHCTGQSKDQLLSQQALFAGRGYLVASIDSRYHGERSDPTFPTIRGGYEAALVRAWREGEERPFLLDTVWDLMRLLDYLETRPDADLGRVGMTGDSLGGMHTWLCAAADERVAVAAPMIGVQCFKWAVDNNRWQGRVGSIPLVFEAAARDLGRAEVDSQVVRAVWDKLLPGLLEHYDAPMSLPLIAPRPLLILNGELDPRCPLEGVLLAVGAAQAMFSAAGAPEALHLFVEKGKGHETSPTMWGKIVEWFDAHLKPA